MRIAVFDYFVTAASPAGSCNLRMIGDLADEHDFTVFAVAFENPRPDRIAWVRIPAPKRPLALLFVWYAVAASVVYAYHRVRHAARFDMVMGIECYVPFATVVYAHFCHRYYLAGKRSHRFGASDRVSARSLMRWLDHRLRAALEPFVYGRARAIVVPSRGLQRELESTYPACAGRIRRIANSVDTTSFTRPHDWDQNKLRSELGVSSVDILLTFVALGHFERKGLPIVLDALRRADPTVKLVVVGGEQDLVESYRRRVEALGLHGRVALVGMQSTVQPYLWAADALVLPTEYETFSLVVLQAAAAGVPPIVTAVNGVEEYGVDGVNGYLVERSADSVLAGINRFSAAGDDQRMRMRQNARDSVAQYSPQRFADAWREFLALNPPPARAAKAPPQLVR